MANKEGSGGFENAIKTYSKGEMVVGIGIALVPGLGGLGALAFISGLAKYEYINSRQGESNE